MSNTQLTSEPLFDVVAVNIQTGARRVMDGNMTEASADGYIRMAVFRRGVEEEFYVAVPAGSEK